MKRIVNDPLNRDDMKDFIEEFYDDLDDLYQELMQRRDYLAADLKNREEFNQPALEQSKEFAEHEAKINIICEIFKIWDKRIDANEIEFEEDD